MPRGAPGAYLCEKLIVNIDVEGETEFESSQKPCNICGSLYIYIYIHIYIYIIIYIYYYIYIDLSLSLFLSFFLSLHMCNWGIP